MSIKNSLFTWVEPFGTRVNDVESKISDSQIYPSNTMAHNSIYLKFERKTCPSSEQFPLWSQIIHEVYHDSNNEVEQIDTFYWTFTHGRPFLMWHCLLWAHWVVSLGEAPFSINILFFFVFFLVFVILNYFLVYLLKNN
jgi:hypothetical protein